MRFIPLVAGPIGALISFQMASELTPEARAMSALMVWIVVWWLTEAIPLAATALFGGAMLVVLGICDAKEAFAPFAHPVIFLFLGGFLIARAMQVHGLDRRLALFVLTRRFAGNSALSAVLTLFAVSAFLSMWISNTATAALMLPITIGVVHSVYPQAKAAHEIVFIGVAYACSLGGLGTPVASPPNAIALGFLKDQKNIDIGFLQWMAVGVPILLCGLAALSFKTASCLKPYRGNFKKESLHVLWRELGKTRREEWLALTVVVIVFLLWVGPGILALFVGKTHPLILWLDAHLPESVAAIIAAALLFLLPGSKGPLLEWKDALAIDWGALILFGGGLSLGNQLFQTGLAATLGEVLIRYVGEGGAFLFLILLVYFAIFFTEVASNTASANLLVPLALSASNAFGGNPTVAVLGVALSCSLAFMMPVATPPNAIVYGTGAVSMRSLMRLGLWMNLVMGAVVLALLNLLVGPFV